MIATVGDGGVGVDRIGGSGVVLTGEAGPGVVAIVVMAGLTGDCVAGLGVAPGVDFTGEAGSGRN